MSTARTTNVAVSAADVVIGTEVVADVQGYADDGSGTYTGTPALLITNPAHQITHLLAVQLGLSLASWIDAATFTQAASDFATAGIRADWGLYAQIDSGELLERFRQSVAARLYLGAAGTFRLFVLPPPGTSVKTFTEGDNVLGPDAGGSPIKAGRTAIERLFNLMYVPFKRTILGDGYALYATTSDATSQTTYRATRALILENDFIRDATAAAAVAAKLLAWHKDQKWRIQFATGQEALHLEPLDKIAVTSARMPGGWTAKQFYIDQVETSLLRAGEVSRVTLTCREV